MTTKTAADEDEDAADIDGESDVDPADGGEHLDDAGDGVGGHSSASVSAMEEALWEPGCWKFLPKSPAIMTI